MTVKKKSKKTKWPLRKLFQKGDRVHDYLTGTGTVARVLKTRLHVNFNGHLIVYDVAHARQFCKNLTEENRKRYAKKVR